MLSYTELLKIGTSYHMPATKTKPSAKKLTSRTRVSNMGSSKKQKFRFKPWHAALVVALVALSGYTVVRFSKAATVPDVETAAATGWIHFPGQMSGSGGAKLVVKNNGSVQYWNGKSPSRYESYQISTLVSAAEMTGVKKICAHFLSASNSLFSVSWAPNSSQVTLNANGRSGAGDVCVVIPSTHRTSGMFYISNYYGGSRNTNEVSVDYIYGSL